jgi:hypothetical protein
MKKRENANVYHFISDFVSRTRRSCLRLQIHK